VGRRPSAVHPRPDQRVLLWEGTIMFNLASLAPALREIPGFTGFSNIKRDGILRTGLQTRVQNNVDVQSKVSQISDVTFPRHFERCGDTWFHSAGRILVEKAEDMFTIRYYDTDTGFDADTHRRN
jgi:hypothetical protein